jgi:hypothetical protein
MCRCLLAKHQAWWPVFVDYMLLGFRVKVQGSGIEAQLEVLEEVATGPRTCLSGLVRESIS